jgi:prepilin signal peptidase PulO-like enzyme (type II secretory pathway)
MLQFLAGSIFGTVSAGVFLWMVQRDRELEVPDWIKGIQTQSPRRWCFFVFFALLHGMVFWLNSRLPGAVLVYNGLSVLLLFSALYDVSFRLIPVSVIWAIIWWVFLSSLLVSQPLPISGSALGAGVVGGVVLLLYVVTRGRGIGEADIFLAGVTGALFGWLKGLLVFSAANFLGVMIILPLIGVFGKERMKLIPLVFFIVFAIFLEWYVGYTDFILPLLSF